MATTTVYIKNGKIFKVGDLLTSAAGGNHFGEGWALTEDYYRGSRGWEVMIFPPINGCESRVECVKHSPNTGRERYRRSFPMEDGAYHLVSTINGAWAYYRRLDVQQWLDRRDITSVQHDSPNGEFREARILSTETSVRRIEITTDGKKEEIGFSSGRTREWQEKCPGTSCHEGFTTYRVTGASWTVVTTVDQSGRRWATLHTTTTSRNIMSLGVPDAKSLRDTMRAASAALKGVFPDPPSALAALREAIPGKNIKEVVDFELFDSDFFGCRARETTSLGRAFDFRVVLDANRGTIEIFGQALAGPTTDGCYCTGSYGRKPIWTILP